ncbi:MAG: PKD domain-containing protein [Rhodothermaceae bacterium]|nr:PKD domain-containing protein [Rhodothermaceae bacterium]
MRTFVRHLTVALSLAILLGLSATVMAQTAPLNYQLQRYTLDSGTHASRVGPDATTYRAYYDVVEIPGAPWLRLTFSEVVLDQGSYLVLTSRQDGARQRLDAVALDQWQHTSAYFNGDAIEIELYVAPGDESVRVRMDQVVVGEHGVPESQCGPVDDRTSSNDPAVGRLLDIGCTAWIIADGRFVSAGHCLSSTFLVDVVEFNVPLSLSNGTLQHPGPEDQYTVDIGSIESVNGGVGNDWGVFEVFDNTQTGLSPIEAQGASFNVVQDLGPATIRITGYGVDSGSDNQTQQTHTGPNVGSSGTTMNYQTDTEGGNSGSPVIDEATGNAVGVHTHGGCSTSGGGNNSGTSTFNSAFWDALDIGGGGNTPPNAGFTFSCTGLACAFADSSADPDGAVVAWDWDFDDGGTSSAQNPAHTFAAPGTYAVALMVTDDGGASDTAAQNVTVTDGSGPMAAFSYSCTDLACDFTDQSSGATFVRWAWDFGDGSSLSRVQNPAHTFPAEGSYTVMLTVNDDARTAYSASQVVTVTGGGGGGDIVLTATAIQQGSRWTGDLTWSPADGGSVDVFRNGALVRSTADDGAFADRLGAVSGTFDYQVCETDSGDCSNLASITIESGAASAEAPGASLGGGEVPEVTALLGAYPNPFTQAATVRYALAESGAVELAVYNLLGQRVAVLASGTWEAGTHEARLDAAALPSGVYVYRLRTGETVLTGRLMLVR